VPISLPNEKRMQLRAHFRLLVNKPVHHRALHALLAGTGTGAGASALPAGPASRLGLRVLVAEDNPVNRRLITRVLERFGCRATIARDGLEAIEAVRARAGEFDLMLLDLHMPEADGLTVLRAMRGGEAGEAARTLPVIALTADAREEQRLQGLEAGLDGYLTKPLEIEALDAVLRRIRPAGDRRDASH
jgi:CheY-like chemotaxis protein